LREDDDHLSTETVVDDYLKNITKPGKVSLIPIGAEGEDASEEVTPKHMKKKCVAFEEFLAYPISPLA
jgi:hypothetical protein